MDIAQHKSADLRLESAAENSACFHCGLPVPSEMTESLHILGQDRHFCCHGCLAVAELIDAQGLTDYYHYRTELPEPAAAELPAGLVYYDDAEIQQHYVSTDDAELNSIRLLSENIRCSACAWLIEQAVGGLPGVASAQVKVAEHSIQLCWDAQSIQLSTILEKLHTLGYSAVPFQEDTHTALQAQQRRAWLRRLGLAGLGMMQVMMYAVALYIGAFADMDAGHRSFLRWVSFAVATPVLLYAAYPFYRSAFAVLKQGHLNMDVPISLALFLAYFASIWATVSQGEHLYFDSVTMFVFFLLLGRYLEFRVRQKVAQRVHLQSKQMPDFVEVLESADASHSKPLLVNQVKVDDLVLIKPGSVVAVDGAVVQGASEVNEAMLNGEFMPVQKSIGDQVLAGSVNGNAPLVLQASHSFDHSYWSQLLNLQEQALHEKPAMAVLADRVARYFVLSVLVLAGIVAVYWWLQSPQDVLRITLAVLVVSCPCALSLATPVALTCGSLALNQRNVLVKSGHFLERLPQVTDIVFDKTGTLTCGKLQLSQVELLADVDKNTVLAMVAALEAQSTHPIADAFAKYLHRDYAATEIQQHAYAGVSGCIEGRRYWFGQPQLMQHKVDENNGLWLCDEQRLLARIELKDGLRENAQTMSAQLQQYGYRLHVLSGDPSDQVRQVAEQLNFSAWHRGAKPQAKINYIRQLQAHGRSVLMIGDGINDAPVMAAADTSLAMAGAADLTRISADAYLLSARLHDIPFLLNKGKQTAAVMKQNLGWALAYNLTMIPLAAAGYVPPYLAAVGMSLSSIAVVMNSLRLKRHQKVKR